MATTQPMKIPQIRTYEDWAKMMADDYRPDDELACPVCGGDGTIEEECCECGHERERECGTCAGEGTVTWIYLSDEDKRKKFAHADYIAAVVGDVKLFAEATNQNTFALLAELGIHVFCTWRKGQSDTINQMAQLSAPHSFSRHRNQFLIRQPL